MVLQSLLTGPSTFQTRPRSPEENQFWPELDLTIFDALVDDWIGRIKKLIPLLQTEDKPLYNFFANLKLTQNLGWVNRLIY